MYASGTEEQFHLWLMADDGSVPVNWLDGAPPPIASGVTWGVPAMTRQVAFSIVRIGLLVALAMLLIMGLLPAALGVQAATY